MECMRRTRMLTGLAAMVSMALLAAPDAGAQEQAAPSAGWGFVFAPYAWGAGITGTVGVADRTADVNRSVGDVIDQVDVSVMFSTEVRYHALGFILDGFYIKLTDDAAVPEAPLTSARVEEEQGMAQLAVSYTILPQAQGGLDLLGGLRYWHTRSTLDLFAGDSSVVNPHDVQQWVDGLLGARYRGRLGARWPVRILGDVGTGGSSFTWEAVGTLGFEFAPCCAVNGGYRYLHYDYERGDNSENLGMGGPVVGLTFRF